MINKSIYSKTLTNDNKIILANVRNGNYIKTNLTYFNYIDESIKKNGYLNLEDVPSNLNRKNLVVLFNALQDIEFYLSKEEEANSLDIAFLAVTNKCNLECLHCSANSNPHGNEGLSRDNIFNIINQLETLKVPNLNITGGEPLIRKDIMKILDYTRKHYSGHITLSSNGLLFNEENAKKIIPLVDEISISVDGYDEETCSLVRGKGVLGLVYILFVGFLHTLEHLTVNNSISLYLVSMILSLIAFSYPRILDSTLLKLV